MVWGMRWMILEGTQEVRTSSGLDVFKRGGPFTRGPCSGGGRTHRGQKVMGKIVGLGHKLPRGFLRVLAVASPAVGTLP